MGKNDNWRGLNDFVPTARTFPETRIAVYTVITGGYDNFRLPLYVDDTLDYYVVTDSPAEISNSCKGVGGGGGTVIPVPEKLKGFSSVKQQRYLKLHHDEILPPKYNYTVYIDGSLRITCDIKPLMYSLIEDGRSVAIHEHSVRDCIYDEAQACYIYRRLEWHEIREQLSAYRSEGMPEHYGLPETPVLIRKSNDPELQGIMHEWWQQIERYTHRDQLSLPYILWKSGKGMEYIFSLGRNVWRNPYFLYHAHN